jgi:hypothetical protein
MVFRHRSNVTFVLPNGRIRDTSGRSEGGHVDLYTERSWFVIGRFMVWPLKTWVNITVFLDIAPCSLVEVYRRFRGAYYLYHQRPHNGGSKHLWNIGKLLPDATSQKAVIFILAAIRTSNLTRNVGDFGHDANLIPNSLWPVRPSHDSITIKPGLNGIDQNFATRLLGLKSSDHCELNFTLSHPARCPSLFTRQTSWTMTAGGDSERNKFRESNPNGSVLTTNRT